MSGIAARHRNAGLRVRSRGRGQKAAWFETLERSGIAVEAKAVPRRALPQWIAGRLDAQQQRVDAATLEFIADRVEGNLMAAHQEVQKLALLFPSGAISFDQVSAAVPRLVLRALPHRKPAAEAVDEYRKRSPAWNVAKLERPLLVHTTTNDRDVNVVEVEHLIAQLQAAGKKFEHKIYQDAPGGHSFNRLDTPLAHESRREIYAFLGKHLQ